MRVCGVRARAERVRKRESAHARWLWFEARTNRVGGLERLERDEAEAARVASVGIAHDLGRRDDGSKSCARARMPSAQLTLDVLRIWDT
eukprot:6189335-Pleurochrysis_carterae.AAC.3